MTVLRLLQQYGRHGMLRVYRSNGGRAGMMALVFTALTAAMLLALAGRSRLATAAIVACMLLSIGEFLWEVYSPSYGFRMPWIQVQLADEGARS